MKLNFKTLCAAGVLMLSIGNVFAMQPNLQDTENEKNSGKQIISQIDLSSEIVDLSEKNLTELPKEIGNLTNSKQLHIYENSLTKLPEAIGNLTNLKSFFAFDNKLTKLPQRIGDLTNLRILWLQGNCLTTLPKEIGGLTNLSSLDLSNNELVTLPKEIGNLTKLEALDLQDNQLTTLSHTIGNLKNLKSLNIWNNTNLTILPNEVEKLQNLESFYINNSLWSISIRRFFPENTGFVCFIEMLYEGIRFLDLRNKNLTQIPPDIVMCNDLIKINLSNNNLESIPLFLRNVKNLEILDISHNNIASLPTEVWPFPRTLKYLTIDGFLLKNIPDDRIESITNMRELNEGKINTEYFTRLLIAKINNQPINDKLLLESLGGVCIVKLKEPPEERPSLKDEPSTSETCKIQ